MTSNPHGILCIGGATIDRKYRALAPTQHQTSNRVCSDRGFGGVARNVAENLARLGVTTSLASFVGDDEGGRSIVTHLQGLTVDTRWIRSLPDQPTAEYVAVLEPNGDLVLGLADMRIFDHFTMFDIDAVTRDAAPGWVFADCNLPHDILHGLMGRRRTFGFRLAVDAVSSLKVTRLPPDLSGIDLIVLNRDEATAYLGDPRLSVPELATRLLARGAAQVIVTCGAEGLVAGSRDRVLRIPATAAQVVDVTGAGDALIAAVLMSLNAGSTLSASARLGTLAAALTLESPASVRSDLSPDLLKSAMHRLEAHKDE